MVAVPFYYLLLWLYLQTVYFSESAQPSESSSNAYERLVENIRTRGRKNVRPNATHGPALIGVSLELYAIQHINEGMGEAMVRLYHEITWFDERLQWTPGDFKGLDCVLVPNGYVWLASLRFIINVISQKVMASAEVYVCSDGQVIRGLTTVATINLRIEVSQYPFDEQKLSVSLGHPMAGTKEIDFYLMVRCLSYHNPDAFQHPLTQDISRAMAAVWSKA